MKAESVGCLALLVIALLLAYMPIGCARGCREDYSVGDRVGVVTKFSNKGVFWKTWEGELQCQGEGSGGVVPNLFRFTVTDPAHVEQVQRAMKTGERVEINYRQWLLPPVWYGSDSIVKDVKATNKGN